MPTKVRGRAAVSRWPEFSLPTVAGQKNEPQKSGALSLLGVSKTALLNSDVLMGG